MSKLAQITIGAKLYIEVNSDPTLGFDAPIGSIVVWDNAGLGKIFFKSSFLSTDWNSIYTGAAIDLTEYFKKDGSIPMSGDILPDVGGTRLIGNGILPFGQVYSSNFIVSQGGAAKSSLYYNGLSLNLDMNIVDKDMTFTTYGTGSIYLKSGTLKTTANMLLLQAGTFSIYNISGNISNQTTDEGTYSINAGITQITSARIENRFKETSTGQIKILSEKSLLLPIIADIDISNSVNFTSLNTSKNRKYLISVFFKSIISGNKANATLDKIITIDENNLLVMQQDSYTYIDPLLNAFQMSFSYLANTLTILTTGLSGLTSKDLRIAIEEITQY